MATLLILEPIFEADFLDCSCGFRPGRSAHQALEEICGHLQAGYQTVHDAILNGYFDSISPVRRRESGNCYSGRPLYHSTEVAVVSPVQSECPIAHRCFRADCVDGGGWTPRSLPGDKRHDHLRALYDLVERLVIGPITSGEPTHLTFATFRAHFCTRKFLISAT